MSADHEIIAKFVTLLLKKISISLENFCEFCLSDNEISWISPISHGENWILSIIKKSYVNPSKNHEFCQL